MFEDYRYEFASLCTEFVEPGENGDNRQEILTNPYKWWERWKELVGNTSREKRAYNVIAEMLALVKSIQMDHTAEWTATRSGSHDIECVQESCRSEIYSKALWDNNYDFGSTSVGTCKTFMALFLQNGRILRRRFNK